MRFGRLVLGRREQERQVITKQGGSKRQEIRMQEGSRGD
jgi:hypothetical protein